MNLLRYNNICYLVRCFHISLQNFNTMFCLYWYAVFTSNNLCILTFYACAMIQKSPCNQIEQLYFNPCCFQSRSSSCQRGIHCQCMCPCILGKSFWSCLPINAAIPVSIKYTDATCQCFLPYFMKESITFLTRASFGQ